MSRIFTSESVTIGHPDKLCDQISDSILDEIIKKDKYAHVACETLATTGLIFVTGEITTDTWVDIENIARNTVNEIGYNDSKAMFNGNTCSVLVSVHQQSPDIAQGVNSAWESRSNSENQLTGAGDQGMMFGYACSETDSYMPLPISLAHDITKRMADLRQSGKFNWMLPDGKSQVTVVYDGFIPKYVDTVVLSTQHCADVDYCTIKESMIEEVIKKSIPANLLNEKTKYYVNPTGRFVVGGPVGDSGLTGRKIIVDTYGGYAKHGGGAFSGKDPTKVDRTASYAARYMAKNIVAAGLADRVEIQLSYAIGVAHPISINMDTFGTAKIEEGRIATIAEKVLDFTPDGMIKAMDLRRPIYKETAKNGHFGKNSELFPWERLDLVDKIKSYI